MMCTALARNRAPRYRITLGNGTKARGNHECLRPVVPDIPLSLCAVHLLLAAQTVDEIGGQGVVVELVRPAVR